MSNLVARDCFSSRDLNWYQRKEKMIKSVKKLWQRLAIHNLFSCDLEYHHNTKLSHGTAAFSS